MASILEKLAAARAAREAKAAGLAAPAITPVPAPAPASVTTIQAAATPMVVTPEHKPQIPPPAHPNAVPMTFAEKLAQKKALAALTLPATLAPKEVAEVKAAIKPVPPATVIPASMVPAVAATAASSAEQAYADIKPRIDELTSLSEEDLSNSMVELRRALMQNPAAFSLMLDEDIGKMVIAMRQMTGEAAEEASKPKAAGAKGKKVKAITLSADDMEAAFAELLG